MTPIKQALLWASAMLVIAVLAVFDVIPAEIAQFSVIALPALAAVSISRRRSKACCSWVQA